MKLFDKETGWSGQVLTNHSMSIDDCLNLFGLDVGEDGQLVDENGEDVNAWYDNLEMDWSAE